MCSSYNVLSAVRTESDAKIALLWTSVSHLEKTCAAIIHFPRTVSLSCCDQCCPMSRKTVGHKGACEQGPGPEDPQDSILGNKGAGSGWDESLGLRSCPGPVSHGPEVPTVHTAWTVHCVGRGRATLTPAARAAEACRCPASPWGRLGQAGLCSQHRERM